MGNDSPVNIHMYIETKTNDNIWYLDDDINVDVSVNWLLFTV